MCPLGATAPSRASPPDSGNSRRLRAGPDGARSPRSELIRDAAGDSGAASAEGRRLIGIIVAARMDDDGATLHVGHPQMRRDNRLRGDTTGISPLWPSPSGPRCFPVLAGS